jgi:hypothetical protein
MAGTSSQMVIRIAANIDELRRNLADGRALIDALGPSVAKYAAIWTAHSATVVQNARNITAAVQQVGASTLTAADSAKALKTLDAAMAQLKATGQPVPGLMRETADSLRVVNTQAGAAGTSFGTLVGSWLTAQAALGMLKTGFHDVVAFLEDCITRYGAAELAQRKLTQATIAHGASSPAILKGYRDLSDAIQRTTIYANDAVVDAEALLIEVGDVMPVKMGKALQATTDLASGLGIDLQTAALLVGKAFAGNTTTLSRYGVVLNQAAVAAGGIDYVLAQLESRFGGQAQAQLDTYSGRIAQLTNNWRDLQKAVGELIVDHPLVVRALGLAADAQTKAATSTDANTSALEALGRQAEFYYLGALGTKILDWLTEYADKQNDIAAAGRRMMALPPPAIIPGALDTSAAEAAAAREGARVSAELDAAREAAKKAAEAYAAAVNRLRTAVIPLTAVQQEEIDQYLDVETGQIKAGIAAGDLAIKVHASEAAIRTYTAALADGRKEIADTDKVWADAAKAFDPAVLSAGLVKSQLDALAAVTKAGADKTLAEYYKQNDEIEAANKALAAAQVKIGGDTLAAQIQYIHAETAARISAITGTDAQSLRLIDILKQVEQAQIRVALASHTWEQAVSGLSQAFSQLAQSGGPLSGFAQTVGTIIGALDVASKGSKVMVNGLTLIEAGGEHAAKGIAQVTAGLVSAVAALNQATQSTNTAQNVISGAATGASAGSAFGVWGIVVGGVVGALWGWARAGANASAEQKKLREETEKLTADFITARGGATVLNASLSILGHSTAELQAQLKAADGDLTATNRILGMTGAALDALKVRQDATTKAVGLLGDMAKATDGTAVSTERLGQAALAAFGAYVDNYADVLGALNAVGDVLDTLNARTDVLAGSTSDAVKQLLDLRAVQQRFKSDLSPLGTEAEFAKALTGAGQAAVPFMQGMAADAYAAYQKMLAGGVAGPTATLLIQPALQQLWEMQSKGRDLQLSPEVQGLIDDAVKSGMVGEDLKSVAEKTLDVLVDIRTALLGQVANSASQKWASGSDMGSRDVTNIPNPLASGVVNPYSPGYAPVPTENILAYHAGGMVSALHAGAAYWAGGLPLIYAHQGLSLAHDEVPIIAQAGERVLSRSETAAYNGGGTQTIIIHNHIEVTGEIDQQKFLRFTADKLGPEITRRIGSTAR